MAASPRPGCTLAEGLSGAWWEFSLAISPDGNNLYVASGDGVAAFSRMTDGPLTQLEGTVGCLGTTDFATPCKKDNDTQPFTDLSASSEGKNLYFALEFGPGDRAGSLVTFSRDSSTGALTLAGCAAGARRGCTHALALDDVSGVRVTPDGRNLYTVGFHGSYPAPARVLAFRRH